MNRIMISGIAAGAALLAASPAAAQFNPANPYGYSPYTPYAYGFGWNTQAYAQSMLQRIASIRSEIRSLASRGVISGYEYRKLDEEAWRAEAWIRQATVGGVYAAEARTIEKKVRHLERNVARDARDRNPR